MRRVEDRVVAEEPLELRLGWPGKAPHRVWVTMRTPGHDFEPAAGRVVSGGLLVVREDVGRHNAVDKVTGARVLAGGVGALVAVGAPLYGFTRDARAVRYA